MDVPVLAVLTEAYEWVFGIELDPAQELGHTMLFFVLVMLGLLTLQYCLGELLHDWHPEKKRKNKEEESKPRHLKIYDEPQEIEPTEANAPTASNSGYRLTEDEEDVA